MARQRPSPRGQPPALAPPPGEAGPLHVASRQLAPGRPAVRWFWGWFWAEPLSRERLGCGAERAGESSPLPGCRVLPLRTGSGKAVAHVIVDSQNSDTEGDDEFVVEAAPQLPETAELELVS